MPIFEYKCPECGFVNEVLVKSADSKPPNCPKCGNKNTEKLFSSFASIIKQPSQNPEKCQTCTNLGQCSDFTG